MSNFVETAEDLIESAENYRKEYLSIENFKKDVSVINSNSDENSSQHYETSQTNIQKNNSNNSTILGGVAGSAIGSVAIGSAIGSIVPFAGPIIGGLIGGVIGKALGDDDLKVEKNFSENNSVKRLQAIIPLVNLTINIVNKYPKDKITLKEVKAITGIEEWKLRRYIASNELTAESKKSSVANPGRSGYLVTKPNLIDFIQKKAIEIGTSDHFKDMIIQLKKAQIDFVKDFLKKVDAVISLGELEIELDDIKVENKELPKKLLLEKKILKQKLELEKNFFKEQNEELKKDAVLEEDLDDELEEDESLPREE